MKVLLVVVACAAAVFLIKPQTTKEEIKQILSTPVIVNDSPAPYPEAGKVEKRVTKLTLNAARTITLMGPVDPSSAGLVVKALRTMQGSKEPVYLLLNSPGGSVLDGAMVISAMEASNAPVYTVCTQMCASMAFVIHQYGVKRLAVDRSILMAHPASGSAGPGQINNMLSLLKTIVRYIDKTDAHIAKRAGLDLAAFHALIAHELWLDAEDATARKFNDEIVFITNELRNTDMPLPDERLRNFKL